MCQVHTGAYVSLLAPGKTDYTARYPRKTTTYILHAVPITAHTHDRCKSIRNKKQREKKKIKDRKMNSKEAKKRKRKGKNTKDTKSKERQDTKEGKQGKEKRENMSY